MASWIQRQSNSHQAQLAATAVLSGAAVAGAILGFQKFRRRERVKRLKASIPEIDEKYHAVTLNEFGAVSSAPGWSKEDERGAVLARRAQEGDYDEGRWYFARRIIGQS
jgi:hypothetical protein